MRKRALVKSGIDTSFMNPAVRPQDDLFRHFAGTWLDTYEIPADRASDGVTRTLYDISLFIDVDDLLDELWYTEKLRYIK